MQFLLIDLDLPQTHALSRMRSIFSLRKGIYSPLERLRLQYPLASIHFSHPDPDYEKYIAETEGLLAYRTLKKDLPDTRAWLENPQKQQSEILKLKESYVDVLLSTSIFPYLLLDKIEGQIKADLALWRKHNSTYSHFFFKKLCVVGPRSGALFLHRESSILPGSIFDTRSGPIIIDKGVQISAFSYLCGPLYVAPNAQLDNVHIKGGSILGESVRAGGEIENSILGNFTNKHHEGFVGHSIIGNWVNLGALSTTSDLKNNYGEIALKIPKERSPASQKISIKTGRIKFGAVIGDHVKTAIGTMINSGTVIDAASNIFGGAVREYVLPFSWGRGVEVETEKNAVPYELERFLKDTEKSAARRSQKLGSAFSALARALYRQRKARKEV